MDLKDQKSLWNGYHSNGGMEEYAHESTKFAQEVVPFFPPKSYVLELGCGLGNDSIFFAERGFNTIATDFSDAAIERNSKKYAHQENLQFQVLDMNIPFPFADFTFDVVYARLSLHYFVDVVTKSVFEEIYRVLKQKGLVCFVCKSTQDPLYGHGEEIEKDMFLRNGHVRHYFSEEYAQECLQDRFTIQLIMSGKENFYGEESGFVKVIAQKD